MNQVTNYQYEGSTIYFEFTDVNRMVNATQMAKTYGKRLDNFLRLQSTKNFIIELEARYSDVRQRENREVLRVVQGGVPELQGTWMKL